MKTPDKLIDNKDPGDDMQRRLRYQAAYAALCALYILKNATNPNDTILEIFCEQFEDILIKKNSQKFIGIQVKTRIDSNDPFKANEEQIINSLKRFTELEKQFINQFDRFTIATNHGFWKAKEDNKNLSYLIGLSKNNSTNAILKNYISKELKGIDEKLCIKVFSKIHLNDNLSKFDDIENTIANEISKLDDYKLCYPEDLRKASCELVNYAFKAASLSNTSSLQNYFHLLENPDDVKIKSTIDGKCINKIKLLDILNLNLRNPIVYSSSIPTDISKLPSSTDRMEKKMNQGKIDIDNINLFKDNKSSLETLILTWSHKYKIEITTKNYERIRIIVQNECQKIYDELLLEGGSFGTKMLVKVRKNLDERLKESLSDLIDCDKEHLYGMAAMLTEQCKIWWSTKFKI